MNKYCQFTKIFLATAIILLQTDFCWSKTQQQNQQSIKFSSELIRDLNLIQFPDNRSDQAISFSPKSYFTKSPRLLNAVTTFNSVNVRYATYYFTIELPEDAGNSIQKIIINQRQGGETINFRLEKTVAFVGTHRQKETRLEIASVTEEEEETKAIIITFASPIIPGTTVTVGLKPKQNPRFGGVYGFGVTAVPTGKKPRNLYLGLGRLHFFEGDGLRDY